MTLLHHTAFNPWREIDRLVGALPSDPRWRPQFDISETDDAYVIVADLPGMAQEDIEVRIADGRLTVRGERAGSCTDKEARCCCNERPRGKFARGFRLPDNVNEDEVKASYKSGVLVLTLPKQEPVDASRLVAVN